MVVDWHNLREVVNAVAGRWRLPILVVLAEGPQRFGELEHAVGDGVTRSRLSSALLYLTQAGLVTGTVLRDAPPRVVVYEITAAGADLVVALSPLTVWHQRYAAITLPGRPRSP